MPNRKLTIAIDGFSSCGKSTLAKMLAKELGYVYIDSGAMYRCVTLYLLEHDAINSDTGEIRIDGHLENINIAFENKNGSNHTILNHVDVEEKIRTMPVTNWVSEVATISEVRSKLVSEQRKLANELGIVMDGRDIGTVVFPYAELKLFITASIEVRTGRRHDELSAKNLIYTKEEVRENLLKRDRIDSSRVDSPLTQADDSIVIDNSFLTKSEQLDIALNLVKKLNT